MSDTRIPETVPTPSQIPVNKPEVRKKSDAEERRRGRKNPRSEKPKTSRDEDRGQNLDIQA